ncbi:MAG: hypothetical protein ACD_3C00057G0004 [uncultured bacterium (gcode 4)]|uniref:Uncharacterized protein n=1 Tax=uncultured bacterium (gcode 4) TaxID=1234023 RepID=K2GDV7_9BACT|nr:MAG: hypothetical protein ACD_3C00057G0004 [uncultured bacterium (gcode 4)]
MRNQNIQEATIIDRENDEVEKMIVINRFLDNILDEEEKTWFSKHLEWFKKIWHKHKYMRLWTWLALSAWAIWATAWWAFVLAAWLLAGRAMLSATWWYMATDAIFDIINKKVSKWSIDRLLQKIKETKDKHELESELQAIYEEIKHKSKDEVVELIEQAKKKNESKENAKQFLSIWVGLTLWIIWWSSVLTAAANPWVREASSLVKSKVWNILSAQQPAVPAKGIDSHLVKDIFKDIKHDHPSQNYVTLEQAERRIIGLKQWIPLDHSEKLNALNDSVAHDIRKPSSGIIKSAKELWFMKEGQSFDEAAKNLNSEKIENMLLKTHENDILPTGNWDILKNWTESIPNAAASSQVQSSIPEIPVKGFGFIKKAIIWTLWLIGLWFMGKKILDKAEKWNVCNWIPLQEENQEIPGIQTESWIGIRTEIIRPKSRRTRQKSTETIIDAEIVVPPIIGNQDKNKERADLQQSWVLKDSQEDMKCWKRLALVKTELSDLFWFKLETTVTDINTNEKVSIFIKAVTWWTMACFYKESWNNSILDISWYDNWTKKSNCKDSFTFNDHSDMEFSSNISKSAKHVLKQLFRDRDKLKNIELANTLKHVEITKSDLKLIYEHLEHPEVIRGWTETVWNWYQNIYSFKDWILRYGNLHNPKFEDMELTDVSSFIKPESNMEYTLKWIYDSMENQFDEFERKIIKEMFYEDYPSISWAFTEFNWHKHPWTLFHPSGWDLWHPHTNAVVNFRNMPNLMTFTWWIVNKLPAWTDDSNKPKNSIIIRWGDYSWHRDYIMYFWRINRNERNSYSTDDLIPINASEV